jgi:hypothetical protein
MGDKLKRGGLGDDGDLDPVPDAFAGSMAAAMEEALNFFLSGESKPTVPVDNSAESRDRRIMFLAIAKGIVDHLVTNQDAFKIEDSLGNPTNLQIKIGNE